MLYRILKKDLLKRKGVNIILYLFITIASVFLAASVSNILVVGSAVEYYLDYANIADVHMIVNGTEEKEQITDWLDQKPAKIKNYGYETFLSVAEKEISVKRSNGKIRAVETGGDNMYLGTVGGTYNKVFTENGDTFSLKNGEIAVTVSFLDKNKLKIGDTITIEQGDTEKEFRINRTMKDATFGNDMAGMNRFIVSKDDFKSLSENEHVFTLDSYNITTEDGNAFEQELNQRGFATVVQTITKDMYKMVYSFDMILAALLILIGICFILIALLVLRFTLVFTIEEDYREIGIMKAVGFRDFAIKKVYLVKYLVIVTAGTLTGLAVSIPVSNIMVKSVSANMIMEDSSANLGINILCALLIILLIMLFCYTSTRKMNKVSAITAIRGGKTGERYKKRAGLKLHRCSTMPIPSFLGINDIASHVRRFVVLIITFCISFILITIPLNTINTMQSDEMVEKFLLDSKAAVYVKRIEGENEQGYRNIEDLKKGMKRVESELMEEGYDARLKGTVIYTMKFGSVGKPADNRILTCQTVNTDGKYLKYSEGEPPKLSNEVAFSEQVMEGNHWKIGDSVDTVVNGENKTFLITGTYSDYMQLGQSARLNPRIDMSGEVMVDYWNIMVEMDTDKTQQEMAEEMGKKFPDYEWVTAQDIVNTNVGGIKQALNDMLWPMTALLCAVIILITVMMEKLFIVREKGEIAMMKSMGFRNRTIRLWQVLRMVFVVLASMAVAVPLSFLSNQYVLKPIFAIMGADVDIQVVPWQVYGTYPGILLTGIIAATVFATRGIRKISIRELNNLE